MVELADSGEWEMRPFSPDYHSRNRCDIVYDPAADCPRFKEHLLSPLMEEDDVELMQKYFGQCLLGRNLTQSILLLTGSGGSWKGTVANLLELLVDLSTACRSVPAVSEAALKPAPFSARHC